MALSYGGQVGGYTTPDGRVVQMPAGLASAFPGLQPLVSAPAPASVPPGGPGPQQIAPSSAAPDPMTALPLPSGGAPAWTPADTANLARQTPVDAQPVTQPSQVPAGGGPARPARGPVMSPAEAPDGGAPQQRRPMTDADLAKMGAAGPANASIAAGDEKRTAIEHQGKALADQATAVGDAMAASEQHAAKLLEDRNQEATRRQVELDQQTQWFTSQAQKIANTKIDRTADHPIMNAIGIALSTLGTAMQNRDNALAAAFRGQAAPAPVENPALKAFYAAIDRKVAAQMQDLDRQKDALQLQGQGIAMGRQAMADRLTQMDVYRAGYLEQAKQQVERIKQQTQSPVIQANADVMLADVSREQADTLGAAQGRWQAHQDQVAARAQAAQMHRETIGVQLRGQSLEQDRFNQQLEWTKRKELLDLEEKYAALGQKAAAEKAKQASEAGIWDPSTGNIMLTPSGRQKMDQADKYEAAARQSQDQDQAAKLASQARALRESATLNDGVVAPSKEVAEKLRPIVSASQGIYEGLARMKEMLNGDPSVFNRDEWARLRTQLTDVQAKYMGVVGERVSPRAFDSLRDHLLAVDPDSLAARGMSKEKGVASIDQLMMVVKNTVDAELKGNGIKSGWQPSTPSDSAAPKWGGKTAAEIGEEARPGVIKQYLVDPIAHPIATAQGQRTPDALEAAATESALGRKGQGKAGMPSNYGLDPDDEAKAKALIARARGAGDAEYARIVSTLSQPLLSGRPALANGFAAMLRDSDPRLYTQVVSQLPPMQQQELAQVAGASQVGSAPVPAAPLSPEQQRQLANRAWRSGLEARAARK